MLQYFFKLKFFLGVRQALRVYFDKVFLKRDISIPFLKHKMKIRYDNFADNQTFNEVILKGAYRHLMNNPQEVTRIIDLGSNIGLSAVSFLSEFPNAELVLVEPEQDNLKVLKENIAPYIKEGRKISLFEAPVFSKVLDLTLYDSKTGSHGFRVSSNDSVQNSIGKIESVTLNGILENNGWDRVDLIKIDIEGSEFELLQENTEWLGKTNCLVIETHDRFKKNCTKQLFKALEPYNYNMSVVNQSLFVSFLKC
jgi:FkbM family methyltransferase